MGEGSDEVHDQLRWIRKGCDLTVSSVAAAMEWSTDKVVRIETGEVSINTIDLRALLAFYEVNDPERVERLVTAAQEYREWKLRRTLTRRK